MSLRRILALASVMASAPASVLFTIIATLVATGACLLALVPTHDLRTVAIRDGALMPELADTLRTAGLAVRDAAPDETTDPGAGTVVLTVGTVPGHPVVRVLRTPGLWTSAPFTLESYEVLSGATERAGDAYKARVIREAGVPVEAMSPIRFAYVDDDGKEVVSPAKAEAVEEAISKGFRPSALLPRRSLAPTLGLALAAVNALGVGLLLLNQSNGRLEGLTGTLVAPGEIILAVASMPARAALWASLSGTVAASCALAWHGLWPEWRWLAIPPVAAAFAGVLTCCALAGYMTFRRPLLAALAGSLATGMAASFSYLPRVLGVMGIGDGWIQSVPFAGIANGLVAGDANAFETIASAATTALVGVLAYRRASRLIDARFFLRREI